MCLRYGGVKRNIQKDGIRFFYGIYCYWRDQHSKQADYLVRLVSLKTAIIGG